MYASVVKIDEDSRKIKKNLEKIILLRDVQNKIYPNLEKTFLKFATQFWIS